MIEAEEAAYTQGQQRLAIDTAESMFRAAGLSTDLAVKLREVHESRANLRSLFEEFGWEWPGDDLYLPDLIEKYLFRRLLSEREE